ncbi:hypothetical protein CMU89_18685 [Elizabethkingia anophelis]|nr:hypothetical protein [Elizabethkingia anophelis]OPB63795.1 hypothetical protein BAS07_09655 [Elizabethkingia anophelis]PKR33566.1 hypothetical protein CWI00_15535 [Elizabethkingia anophelis]PRQ86895.1 hypothetical protein CMT87_00040 [Elizabethkingia anophelis]
MVINKTSCLERQLVRYFISQEPEVCAIGRGFHVIIMKKHGLQIRAIGSITSLVLHKYTMFNKTSCLKRQLDKCFYWSRA